MRIKEIELDNFKSFGEKTVLPILPGFTTVSGPNGSGKSNVVDSLMFVLGLTSTRNMRAERLTDLLNNISGKHECSVRVVFADDDGTQIEVKRKIRVKKDDNYDSKYFLNEKPSTLGQIHDKLAEYNISPKGFNVVMQGDVSSIISMSAVDRRKIVDEIAGVSDFDRKIELAKRELEVVLERIESQDIILKEISARLNQLQQDRDKAIKYADLKTKRTALERRFLLVRIKQVEKQAQETELELARLEELKISLKQENNTNNTTIYELEKELENLNKTIEELGEGKQRSLGLKRDEVKQKLTRLESQLEYQEKQVADYEGEHKSLIKEAKTLRQKLKNINFRSAEFSEEKGVIQANITEEEAKYAKVQAEIKEISLSSQLNNQNIMQAQSELSESKDKLAKLEQNETRLVEKNLSFQEKIDSNRSVAEEALTLMRDLETQQSSGNFLELDELKEQIAFQSRNIQTLKDEQKDTKLEVANQEGKLRKVEKLLSQLEGQEQAANAAGYGRAVEMVLNQDGVHGTLAQLGNVSHEYALALETAAGARLRSVVVEDDYVAQDCINYLRNNRAGRATFLPLNKLARAKSLPPIHGPGIIDWAINLVDFDSEYEDAFNYAFAGTLVVKNIEVSRKLIGRYRMVTLQGDLVERSGAMSGGSAIKTNIHFGANSSGEKQKLLDSQRDLENYIQQLKSEEQDLLNQTDEAQTKLEALRATYSEKSAQSKIDNSALEQQKNTYEQAKTAISEAASKQAELDEELNILKTQIQQISGDVELKEKILKDNAALLKDSGLEALMDESKEIEVEIKRYRNMLADLNAEEQKLAVEKNFTDENINGNQLKTESISTELEKIRATIPDLLQSKQEIAREIDNLEAEIEKIKDSLKDLNLERGQLGDKLMQCKERRGQISSQIESSAIKTVELKRKLTQTKENLTELLKEAGTIPEEEKNLSLSPDEIKSLQNQIDSLERQMRSMEPINMLAVEEYKEVKDRETEICTKQEALKNEHDMLVEKSNSYLSQKQETFSSQFNIVNKYFQEIFANLSFGQGQLILEDPEDIFNGGLIIKAQPRGKKMQRLEAMSGGEKSLTALSFLFALQQCNPAPFYAFDEVDSALDGVNVDRLAEKIKDNAKNTQFLVVSHRRPMLEKSDRMIGVSLNKRAFSTVIGVQNINEQQSPALV
jgi:chromosome segregation protein